MSPSMTMPVKKKPEPTCGSGGLVSGKNRKRTYQFMTLSFFKVSSVT